MSGEVSYYGDECHGKKTANGETFDMNAMTAAHRDYPFNTKIRVTNQRTGKSVDVRINDRGPEEWTGRGLDLSKAAFAKVENLDKGIFQGTFNKI